MTTIFEKIWVYKDCPTQGESCWCGMIETIDGNTVVDVGSIDKGFAKYFVNIHNEKLSILTQVDLRICKPGQKLRSKHGWILIYRKRNTEGYYQHTVEYPDGTMGTRTDSGHVYKRRRLEEDHDVVAILNEFEGDERNS